jgi:hypothetical protein
VHVPICFLSRQRAVDAAAIEGRRAAARRGVRATGGAGASAGRLDGGSSGRLAAAETNRDGSRHYDGATSSRQPRHHDDRRTEATPPARAFTDARPRPTVRTTSDLSPPHQPPALFVASTVHAPLLTSSRTPALCCLALIAAAPRRPDQLPPGLTHQVYLDGRGRGASATRWPPFLVKPRREAKRTRLGGAAACSPLRRTPRNEPLETNPKRRTGGGRERSRRCGNEADRVRLSQGARVPTPWTPAPQRARRR